MICLARPIAPVSELDERAHFCDTCGLRQAKGPSPFTFTLAEPAVLRAVSVSKVGLFSPVKSEDYAVEHSASGGIAGVGLLIEQEVGSSQVVVTKVTPGGAAAREGRQVLHAHGVLYTIATKTNVTLLVSFAHDASNTNTSTKF